MLEAVCELSLDHLVTREGVKNVVVSLGLRERERHHEVGRGPKEQLDGLLQIPLRESVKLGVGLELGVLDRLKVLEERRVLTKTPQTRAHVGGVDREAIASRALGESLRLDLVVLLELEVLHRRARLVLDTPLLIALVEETPGPDDLPALEERGLVQDDDVEGRRVERLRKLAEEVHLVTEELVRLHTL